MKTAHISTETARAGAPTFGNIGAGRWNGSRLLGYAGFVLVLCAVLWSPLRSLVAYVGTESLHSHILLVPFISAYLIYLQRAALPKASRCSPVCGAVGLAIGLAALVVAARLRPEFTAGDYLSLFAFAFVTLVIAGGFLFLGRTWMAAVAFPVGFLYFMVPLPDHAVEALETALKLGSAEVAALFFNFSGTPVFRDGVIFQLPNITLEVAQECSGIRSSWILLITSVLASYLLLKSPWRRAALLAVVLPLAILRNGFRILVIGLLCVHMGPHMIHSMVHQSGGPLFFALSLVPLFLWLWWLRKGEETKTPSEK